MPVIECCAGFCIRESIVVVERYVELFATRFKIGFFEAFLSIYFNGAFPFFV